RCHHQRLWGDVFLCRARADRGPLGDHRLYSRLAAQSARQSRGRTAKRARAAADRQPAMSGLRKSRLGIATLLGLGAILVSCVIDSNTLLPTYLASVVAISAIPAGSMAVLMVTYLVRGRWTEALHIPLTAAALTTPIAAVLFIPVLIVIPWLYP